MKKYILLVFVVIIALAGYFLLARGQHKLAANAAVSVTDSTGAKVHIPAEPKRIVFLNASIWKSSPPSVARLSADLSALHIPMTSRKALRTSPK